MRRPPATVAAAVMLAFALGCPAGLAPGPDAPAPPDAPDAPEATPEPLPDAGSVLLRRLNARELDEAFQHGFGSELRPAASWPPDPLQGGFDTNAQALTTSSLHVETLELAAWKLADELPVPPCSAGAATCAPDFLQPLAEAAWRRPLDERELDSLVGVAVRAEADGAPTSEALRAAVAAIVLSPRFLFRVEVDPEPGSPEPHALDPYELATRLSHFLWSGPPDADLLAAASQGGLGEDALREQVARMLADPRAEALVDGFGGRWMPLARLDQADPFADLFPAWRPELRQPMADELRRELRGALLDDRSMLELLTYETVLVGAELAELYGLDWASGEPAEGGLRRFSLEGTGRRGVLGNAALLTALAQPATVSPAARGVWILEHLLCESMGAPPPDAEAFIVQTASQLDLSEREILEAMHADAACAECHDAIDPLGFALHGFDGAGATRDTDMLGFPVDASGEFEGEAFDGAARLAELLVEDPRLPACIAERAFTYALGRAPTALDHAAVVEAEVAFATSGHRFSALAEAIVLSPAFRTRRAPDGSR